MGLDRLVLGFVKGAADYGADSIQKRQQMEAELQKEKLLMQLRQEESDYTYNRSLGEVEPSLTENDYEQGTTTYKNKKGEVLSVAPMDAAEKQAYLDKQTKSNLENENIRSQITSRSLDDARGDAQLAISRAQLGLEGQRIGLESKRISLEGTKNSGLHGAPDGNSLDARANELLYQNKDIRDGLIKAGVPAETVTQMAQEVVTQAAARAAQGKPVSLTAAFAAAAAALRAKAATADWRVDSTTSP